MIANEQLKRIRITIETITLLNVLSSGVNYLFSQMISVGSEAG